MRDVGKKSPAFVRLHAHHTFEGLQIPIPAGFSVPSFNHETTPNKHQKTRPR